jgi:hypothetical protein
MNLREFLDAAYTLLMRYRMAAGDSLTDALEKLAPFAAVTLGDDMEGRVRDSQARADLRREEREMKKLEAVMRRAGMPTMR